MKHISSKYIKALTERHDENGDHIPFSIAYVCLDGSVKDLREKEIICIGVDPRHRRRTIKHRVSGKIRTIHDCLILRINDSKIVIK